MHLLNRGGLDRHARDSNGLPVVVQNVLSGAMADAPQVLIPKVQLPDCAVGETLVISGEDAENFIVEPAYDKESPAAEVAEGEMPAAIDKVA